MHFRIRKSVVQLVRNTYNPASKKAVASVVARMPLAEPILTEEIRRQLTPAEISEVAAWIEGHHRISALRGELAFLELSEKMDLAAQWCERNGESGVARNTLPQVLHSWQRLRGTLKKAGLLD